MKRVTDLNYWMDANLKSNLNTICYNLDNDFDFICGISGTGMVRIGKSMVAQQVGYYVAWKKQTPFTMKNIVFSGEELINTAHQLPPNSVIIYDEARGELDAKKTMEAITKSLLDFFAECGIYNHFILLVLPDFFELTKGIAIARSDFLINVFRTSEKKTLKNGDTVMAYKRGFFEFYNRKQKKLLYIHGKKKYDTYIHKYRNFWGEFRKFWVLDPKEYEQKKLVFLQRDRLKSKNKELHRFTICLKAMNEITSQQNIAELLKKQGLKISQQRISQLVNENQDIEA